MISKDSSKEPRFQINDTEDTGILVGKNVENWKSGNVEGFNSKTLAYPIENLGELDNGEYVIQALLHKYETFNLSNGKTVKLPMDQGEGNIGIPPQKIFIVSLLKSISKKQYCKN